jgi:type VI secretion system protein ImpC
MTQVNIDIDPVTHSRVSALRTDASPFRIAILGDFSGRANRGIPGVPRKPVEIDPDNFEQVMERMEVGLDLSAGEVSLMLRFRELDDFHPDRLYQSVPLFRAFSEARKELSKPRPAAPPKAQAAVTPAPVAPTPVAPATGGSLLDAIVAQSGPAQTTPPIEARPSVTDASAWDDAIRGIVAKHVVPQVDPQQESVLAQLNESAAAAMRGILGHPEFQSLEAAWRSVFLLFRHVDASVDLKVYLVDAARVELSSASLPALLNDGEPWGAILGLYTFFSSSASAEYDGALLARMGAIARQADGPFLSAVHPRLFGCESIGDTPDPDDWGEPLPEVLRVWQQLRRSPDAKWLGLAMPRFLLRVPYGAKTSPIDSFEFEEMPGPAPDHESYLWGNPAIISACLLGASFNRDGWDLRPGAISRIGGIPVHAYAPGEITPPAEIWINERFAEQMLDRGVMPLASVKHSDEVMLVRFQSIADPPSALAGAW